MNHYENRNSCNLVIIDEVFDNDEIDLILHNCKDLEKERARTIGKNSDQCQDIRKSDIAWLSSFNGDEHFHETVRRVNENVFGFQLHDKKPDVQFTEYRGQDRQMYDWHPDGPLGLQDYRGFASMPRKSNWRKLSAILMLTDPESYDGGELSVLNPSAHIDECIQSFKLDKGSVAIFPSFLAHKVHPVKRGIRRSLVMWYEGYRWQ